MTAKVAAVLTAVLTSALVKAANMEPIMFVSTASTDWGVVTIALKSSASASSSDRSLTRTPAPGMILAGSKCWTAVPRDRDHLQDVRKRAEGLRRGPV